MEFILQKKARLQKNDISRKGSIDDKIIELVNFINSQDCYATTSSCSGRIAVFTNSELRKKGCQWIYLSHDTIGPHDVVDALNNHTGSAILKFEPFILHVQCSSVEDAQKLHSVSVASGFRNSGMTISKKGNIVVAIRSTLSLEVPLSCDGVLLVSQEYITFVVNECNNKMKENWKRIERLFLGLENVVTQSTETAEIKKVHKVPFQSKDISLSSTETNQQEEDHVSPDMFYDGFDTLLNNTTT